MKAGDRHKKNVVAAAAAATAALIGVSAAALVRALRELDIRVGGRTRAGRVIAFTDTESLDAPVRMMAVGRAIQSGTFLGVRRFEAPFAYHRAFDVLFDALPDAHDVLMIGGGGFAWPKAALSSRPSLCVDVCEPEAAVTRAARAWFYLDELEELAGDRLRIFETDGISHLAGCDRLYDAIIDDAFSGFAAAEDLLSDEGLALVRSRLAPGGLFLANVVCGADASPLFELVGRMERTFAQVNVLITTDEALSDDDNYLIIASDANYRFEGALS